MKITNKNNLPLSLVRAVEKHDHKGGDYSASALGKSPREYWLTKRHYNNLESDVSENIWSLFGTAVHHILEQSATENQLVEEFMQTFIEGKTFTGIADCLERGENGYKIIDYKTTSAWSIIYKDKMQDWENQLNAYCYLFSCNDFCVTEISVIAILRDWQKSKAKYDSNYPKSQVLEIKLDVWSKEKQLEYITDNILRIEAYGDFNDDDLPECTNEELWMKPDAYAVMKDGRKSAVRVLYSLDDATKYIIDKKLDGKHRVEIRKSKAMKCNYCPCTKVCNQHKLLKENNLIEE